MLATGLAIEMSFVAMGWQVYAVRSNPLDLGLVGLAMFVPLPLLALPAGHLADRFPRRTLLAIATGLDTAIMIGLFAVTRAGADQTWPFFLLAFGTGVASALGAPAVRALTPSLVPREILVRLSGEIRKAMQAADLKERYLTLGLDAASSTPEEMGAFMQSQRERYAAVIKGANIKIEQ